MMSKRVLIGLTVVVLCLCGNLSAMATEEGALSGGVFDGPVYFSDKTNKWEPIEPMPYSGQEEESSVDVTVVEMTEKILASTKFQEEFSYSSKYYANDKWGMITGDYDKLDKKVLLGWFDSTAQKEMIVQFDIEKDGKWICGAQQVITVGQAVQFKMSKPLPYRCFIWYPDTDNWEYEFGLSTIR